MSESKRALTKKDVHEMIEKAADELGEAIGHMLVAMFAAPPTREDSDGLVRTARALDLVCTAMAPGVQDRFAKSFREAVRFNAGID